MRLADIWGTLMRGEYQLRSGVGGVITAALTLQGLL